MTALEPDVKAEAQAAAKSMLRHPERGALVYSEKQNKKARRARGIYLASSLMTVVGLFGIAIIILYFTVFFMRLPSFVQVIGGILALVLIYWAAANIQDFARGKKALRHLKVYDLGLRLPMGTEADVLRGRAPRFIPFDKVVSFYPNEGNVEFPYSVIVFDDPEAPPLLVWKEYIGDWGRFRKSVKDKMAIRRDWYYVEKEGPAFGGDVKSDESRLVYGDKEKPSRLSWDAVAEEPKAHMKGLSNLAVLTVKLRKGGKLKFLVPLAAADRMIGDYRKYEDKFWKEPDKEEERWEELEEEEEGKS